MTLVFLTCSHNYIRMLAYMYMYNMEQIISKRICQHWKLMPDVNAGKTFFCPKLSALRLQADPLYIERLCPSLPLGRKQTPSGSLNVRSATPCLRI